MRRHSILLAVLVAVIAFVAAPVTGSRTTRHSIVVSSTPDRAAPVPLRGRAVVGQIYVFLRGAEGARAVRYYLDDPGRRKRPRRVARAKPFDFVGRNARGQARPLSTTGLAGGAHTVTAVVDLRTGVSTIVQARFTVPSLSLRADGSDTNPCTSRAPCSSFDRAYRVARPGQVVDVAAGSYGAQRILDDPAKKGAGQQVVIRAASGASVTIGDLVNFASNVKYQGFTIVSGQGQPDIRGGHDITVQDVRATNFYVQGPTVNVTFRGGEYGPFASCGGGSHIKTQTRGGDDPNPSAQPKNTVVDGVYFHDYTVPDSCPDAHLDCLHVFYHQQLTVRNSRFVRCRHYGILLGSNGAGEAENDLIENNFFGTAEVAGFAFRGGIDEFFDGVTVRYNSGDYITPQTRQAQLSNIKWYANVSGNAPPCREGIDYGYNVAPDGACSRTDRRAATGFVDPRAGDYHLRPGSAAIGRGNPRAFPRVDFDRQARPRPRKGAPDAGADEH
jgi:hypothetical protein